MGHGSSVLGFVALAVCVIAVIALRTKRNVSAAWPVYARPVMSEVERQLFNRLIEAFPEKLVLPQVQVCRFVEVRNVPGRTGIQNRYSRLSADFVICNADSAVERGGGRGGRARGRGAARGGEAE